MEILSLTAIPATGFEAIKAPLSGVVEGFNPVLAGMKAQAPPGPEPPPIPPIQVKTGEEGATLEPIAPTQIPDFSPETAEGKHPLEEWFESSPAQTPLHKLSVSAADSAVYAIACLGPIQIQPVQTSTKPAVSKIAEETAETQLQPLAAEPKASERAAPLGKLDAAPPKVEEKAPKFDPFSKESGRKDKPDSDFASGVQPEKPERKPDFAREPKPAQPEAKPENRKGQDPVAKPKLEIPQDADSDFAVQSVLSESVHKPVNLKEAPLRNPEAKPKIEVDSATEGDPGINGAKPRETAKGFTDDGAGANGEKPKKGFAPRPVPKLDLEEKTFEPHAKPVHLVDGKGGELKVSTAASASDNKIELSPKQSESVVRQVADRLESLAAKSLNQKVTIHLDPKDFGSITLVVRQSGKEVDAEVYASNDSVRQAITTHQMTLQHALDTRGIQLGQMTVGSELPHGSGRQDQATKEMLAQTRQFHAREFESATPSLSLDAMRTYSRKATGVDLWI